VFFEILYCYIYDCIFKINYNPLAMRITSIELEKLERINSTLRNYGYKEISIDELVDAAKLSPQKNIRKALENLFLYRSQVLMNNNELDQISNHLYAASIALVEDFKDSAIKLRRYSNQFKMIKELLQSNILWTVSYIKDNECKKCEHLSKVNLDIEKEVVHPSCPVLDCTLPYNIC